MKPIKNKKRVDPRYFLNETAEGGLDKLQESDLTVTPKVEALISLVNQTDSSGTPSVYRVEHLTDVAQAVQELIRIIGSSQYGQGHRGNPNKPVDLLWPPTKE